MFNRGEINKGFTLVEIIVVIAIIGILATLSGLALDSTRAKARDAKRVNDISEIRAALGMYKLSNSVYPSPGSGLGNFTLNAPLVDASGREDYMAKVPSNPRPTSDGVCATYTNFEYAYSEDNGGVSYSLNYCLGQKTGDLGPGICTATPAGMCDNLCTPSCGTQECGTTTSCGVTLNCDDITGGCASGLSCVNGVCLECQINADCGSYASCDSNNKCVCQTNYGNCDANWSNGCETFLLGNDNNCGSCGNSCGGPTPYCGGANNNKCVTCASDIQCQTEFGSLDWVCATSSNGTGCNVGQCALDRTIGQEIQVYTDFCNITVADACSQACTWKGPAYNFNNNYYSDGTLWVSNKGSRYKSSFNGCIWQSGYGNNFCVSRDILNDSGFGWVRTRCCKCENWACKW